jgi:formamidopyrimidine-DNA glycosylase
VPELPEVEATAQLLDAALKGATIESTLAPGVNVLKTFDPPLHALDGATLTAVRRTGKLLLVDAGELTLLVHLMNAGRLQLFDKRASLKDRSSRLLLRPRRRPRAAPARVRHEAGGVGAPVPARRALAADEHLAGLGPEAWPIRRPTCASGCRPPRPLHSVLRDQTVIAGIGRTWVDDILHAARLSPFKRGDDLADEEAAALSEAIRASSAARWSTTWPRGSSRCPTSRTRSRRCTRTRGAVPAVRDRCSRRCSSRTT